MRKWMGCDKMRKYIEETIRFKCQNCEDGEMVRKIDKFKCEKCGNGMPLKSAFEYLRNRVANEIK